MWCQTIGSKCSNNHQKSGDKGSWFSAKSHGLSVRLSPHRNDMSKGNRRSFFFANACFISEPHASHTFVLVQPRTIYSERLPLRENDDKQNYHGRFSPFSSFETKSLRKGRCSQWWALLHLRVFVLIHCKRVWRRDDSSSESNMSLGLPISIEISPVMPRHGEKRLPSAHRNFSPSIGTRWNVAKNLHETTDSPSRIYTHRFFSCRWDGLWVSQLNLLIGCQFITDVGIEHTLLFQTNNHE